MNDLPKDLLKELFQHVKFTEWHSVLLTCKYWLLIGSEVFDPSAKKNRALRWACQKGFPKAYCSFVLPV